MVGAEISCDIIKKHIEFYSPFLCLESGNTFFSKVYDHNPV